MSTPQPAAVEEVEQESDDHDEPEPSEQENVADDPFDGEEEEPDIELAETDIGESTDEVDEQLNELNEATERAREERADDPFDGEESYTSTGGGGPSASSDTASEAGSFAGDMASGDMAGTINAGAARLSVVGLPDQFMHDGRQVSKEDLADEFEEVFETFQLGRFGSEVAEEYLDTDPDEVDPVWGLVASMILCTVVVIQMRPDGDVLVTKAKNGIGGAVSGGL